MIIHVFSSNISPYAHAVTRLHLSYNNIFHAGQLKFMLGGQTYLNNSVVSINDIGEGDNALLCVTDNPDCCFVNKMGDLFYPNNSVVGYSSINSLYRNRGQQMVRLNRRNDVLLPTVLGAYRCEIPDSGGRMQNIYIYIKGIIIK